MYFLINYHKSDKNDESFYNIHTVIPTKIEYSFEKSS